MPLGRVVDEVVVEAALAVVYTTLVGASAYLGESRRALDGLFLLGRSPLLPLLLDLRGGVLVGRVCVEGVRDAGLFLNVRVGVAVEGGVGVLAVVGVEGVLAIAALLPFEGALVAEERHAIILLLYSSQTLI